MKFIFRGALLFALLIAGQLFGATGAPFAGQIVQGISDPRQMGNLSAWYDSSDATTLTLGTGDKVRLWADKSGNSGTNALCLNGVAGNYASAPASVAVNTPSQLDIMVDLSVQTVVAGVSQTIISQLTQTGNQRAWFFALGATGFPALSLSSDGTALSPANSSAIYPFAANVRGQLRVTWDGATGNVLFYSRNTSADAWVQLGTTQVALVGSVFNSTAPVTVSGFNAGAASQLAGNVYRAAFSKTVGGAYVFDANFTAQAKLATSFTESSVNAATVTINTSGDTGARISGARDLYQGTVSKQPVYLPWVGSNYGYLNAVSGNYFSTPNAAPVQITGDIDLRAYVALDDWTPAAAVTILGKSVATGNQRAYRLFINATSGNLGMNLSQDGTATISASSTIAPTVADMAALWIRATWRASDGRVQFFTGTDGVNWTQLGADASIAYASIFNSSAGVEVGSTNVGSATLWAGKIYRAQIYNGIAGTLAFDFNPAAYTSGTTLLDQSVNAATITINAGATIVTRTQVYGDGSDDYMKAAAFSLSQPETVYFTGQQVTNTLADYIYDGSTSAAMGLRQAGTTAVGLAASTTGVNINVPLQTSAIITGLFNGASSAIRSARTAATTGDAGTGTPNGLTLFSIGQANSQWANATVSELALYAAAHTTAQQDAYIGYQARKWRISGGFAYQAPTPVLNPGNILPFPCAPWRREDEIAA